MADCSPIWEDTWLIPDDFVYLYLLKGEHNSLFLDSGANRLDLPALAARLGASKPQLALTHGDADHASGTDRFPSFSLHPADFWYLAHSNPHAAPHPIWDGDRLELGGRTVEVIHLPGHTPGSVAYLDRTNRLLFCGDLVQKDLPIHLFGTGRSIPAYLASLERLYSFRDRYDRIFPGHGRRELDSGDLLDLIRIVRMYLDGSLEAEGPAQRFPCQLYRCGDVQFYAD